jgi:hypothetical protein
MKKALLFVFIVLSLAIGTQISLPYIYGSGDTLFAPTKENANNRAIANVVNGNLKNDNIHAEAAITQGKIDSLAGWITNSVGVIKNAGQEIRSAKGMSFFVNDSTVYGSPFRFISDSTDTAMIVWPDSIVMRNPLTAGLIRFSPQNKTVNGSATWSYTTDYTATLIIVTSVNAATDSIFFDNTAPENTWVVIRNQSGTSVGIKHLGSITADTVRSHIFSSNTSTGYHIVRSGTGWFKFN